MQSLFPFNTRPGKPHPLGATREQDGVNFALFATDAEAVTLCLHEADSGAPLASIALDFRKNRTGKVWHIFIQDLPPFTQYAYRVDGPCEPSRALFYTPERELLDPFALGLVSHPVWGARGDGYQARGIVDAPEPYDWEGDTPPRIPHEELIIYEMHVRGFTKDPSSGVAEPGTFAGVIEKIPYLQDLGVNAVELLPIFEWDESSYRAVAPKSKQQLVNFWGYAPLNYFCPMMRYAAGSSGAEHARAAVRNFRRLVKELHRAGIEVILDVVYNHTGESASHGPSISYRGLAPSTYYMVDAQGHFMNYSGCGNTLKCNTPIVRELILRSLRYWVTEMHVDGFRFDLASILTREASGAPMHLPPVIEAISQDPVLAETKLIAEAWDAGGLYQVGQFPSWGKWSEWNGRYRDAVRCFIKGTPGNVDKFGTSLCGSENIYGAYQDRGPPCSVNFITAHDGFSLRDLVSYNQKHNLENGEENRDGTDHNESWNCGIEGPSRNQKIVALRRRQMRNFHLALMVSRGIPLLAMGDEYGHARRGNNNAWCQDNALNWFQWNREMHDHDFFRFYRGLIHFRKRHRVLWQPHFFQEADITWHGVRPNQPNWAPESRFIAYCLHNQEEQKPLYIAFNANYRTAKVHLPPAPDGTTWHRIVDTALPSPDDYVEEVNSLPLQIVGPYAMPPYSAILLLAT